MKEQKQTTRSDVKPGQVKIIGMYANYPVARMKLYSRHARLNERAVEAVERSLARFGPVAPVILDQNGRICAGDTRYKAAKKAGLASFPAVICEFPGNTFEAYSITDNQTAAIAEWDMSALGELLKELEAANFDMPALGFKNDEIELILASIEEGAGSGETDPDDIPAALKKAKTKPGQLWLLGEHRLLCGDSTKSEDVARLMNGERAILFSTDPPYLVGYDGTNHPSDWSGIRGLKKKGPKDWSETYGRTWDDSAQGPEFYEAFIGAAIEGAIQDRAAWYCWHASARQAMLEAVWAKFGAHVHQQIIWLKDRPVLTRCWYMWQHEPCFFGWVSGHKPPRRSRGYLPGVWEFPTVKPGTETEHPTSKPVELFAIPMRQHTRRGDLCYEPFCGSGSELIAAEELGRRCYAMEIEPVYCDVTIKRWENFTGKKAALAK